MSCATESHFCSSAAVVSDRTCCASVSSRHNAVTRHSLTVSSPIHTSNRQRRFPLHRSRRPLGSSPTGALLQRQGRSRDAATQKSEGVRERTFTLTPTCCGHALKHSSNPKTLAASEPGQRHFH